MPPSKASSAAYVPCRAAPGLLGGYQGVQGPGRSRASTAGGRDGREPGRPGGGGPEAGPPGRARTPGPASGRTQPERDGVARVPGGRPARDEGESGPDAAPPSEGLAAARGSGRGPPEVIQLEVRVQADPVATPPSGGFLETIKLERAKKP